jgi:hypothetical protein
MPGSFSKDARPVRPGAYFNWEAQPTTTIPPNIGSVVALPIIHDWGPTEQIISCLSLGDFQSKFGPSTDTPGYGAVMQCFKGEGVSGRGGAGEILVYRMTGASAKAGSVALNNTTSAPALTLTALYDGSYSDALGVRVRVSSVATNVDVLITLNDTIIEQHTADGSGTTPIQTMVDQINQTSKWVSAVVTLDGTGLNTSQPSVIQPFVGGDDGATLLPADWMDTLDALSAARFSLFAPFDLTDPSIQTSVQAWSATLNTSGKRFLSVIGGDPTDTATAAITRSTAMSGLPGDGGGENFVNLGVGTLIDDTLGTLSTSQLAPRVAGILAARGEAMSLTFARMQGTSAGVLPSDADVSLCFDGGVVVFGMDSNADSPIRVEKGLTCYTGGDDSKPYLIYRNPKFVRTMQGIEGDITDWATGSAIGLLQVNDQTRALVVGYGHQVMEARAGLGVIQDGYTVGVDPTPPPTDDDEFIAVVYGIAFGRSVEQIYNTVYIS